MGCWLKNFNDLYYNGEKEVSHFFVTREGSGAPDSFYIRLSFWKKDLVKNVYVEISKVQNLLPYIQLL